MKMANNCDKLENNVTFEIIYGLFYVEVIY